MEGRVQQALEATKARITTLRWWSVVAAVGLLIIVFGFAVSAFFLVKTNMWDGLRSELSTREGSLLRFVAPLFGLALSIGLLAFLVEFLVQLIRTGRRRA